MRFIRAQYDAPRVGVDERGTLLRRAAGAAAAASSARRTPVSDCRTSSSSSCHPAGISAPKSFQNTTPRTRVPARAFGTTTPLAARDSVPSRSTVRETRPGRQARPLRAWRRRVYRPCSTAVPKVAASGSWRDRLRAGSSKLNRDTARSASDCCGPGGLAAFTWVDSARRCIGKSSVHKHIISRSGGPRRRFDCDSVAVELGRPFCRQKPARPAGALCLFYASGPPPHLRRNECKHAR